MNRKTSILVAAAGCLTGVVTLGIFAIALLVRLTLSLLIVAALFAGCYWLCTGDFIANAF